MNLQTKLPQSPRLYERRTPIRGHISFVERQHEVIKPKLQEAFKPEVLSRLLKNLVVVLSKRIGVPFKQVGSETLRKSRRGVTFQMKYTSPIVELRFNFLTKEGEKVESIDVYPKRAGGRPFMIKVGDALLVNKVKELAEIIKQGNDVDDPDLQLKKLDPTMGPILSPAEKLAQQDWQQYEIAANDLEATLESLKKNTNYLIGGYIPGIIVSGTGGVGKSHTVEQVLEDQLGPEGQKWEIFSGGSMGTSTFYEKLYEGNGKVLVFDDVLENVLGDDQGIAILKGALQTNPDKRRVNWSKKGKISAPPNFIFKGQIIIITNEDPRELFKGPAKALATRMTSIPFDVSTDQVVQFIEKILDGLDTTAVGKSLSPQDKRECFEFFKKYARNYKSSRNFGYVSIRALVNTMNYYVADHAQWQKNSFNFA